MNTIWRGMMWLSCLIPVIVLAQEPEKGKFVIDGQMLQRAEYRHGHIEPLRKDQKAAKFITQRARLQALYSFENLNLFMSVQDIRTWGDSPQVKRDDNNFSLHEAYAHYKFDKQWSIKVGRQELNYDNARFLGNLDWFMQGRAHDFAMIRYEKGNRKLHIGGGYNQNGGNLPVVEVPYLVPNQYKSAQMLRYENKSETWHYSFLAWNESRQNTQLEGNPHFDNLTFGLPNLQYTLGKNQFSGFAYYQTGKDFVGKSLSAHDVSAQYQRTFFYNETAGKRFRMIVGFELLSGTNTTETENNYSFNPLYGTNHLFNGYMDAFYVANRHLNSVGLNDYYLKGRYEISNKFFAQLDYHYFQANANVNNGVEKLSSGLGSEIDLSLGYIMSPVFSIQGGYSHLFQTDTYDFIKGGNLQSTQNWVYIMLIFRPNIIQKFIGILF
jgi:hypothetical protein